MLNNGTKVKPCAVLSNVFTADFFFQQDMLTLHKRPWNQHQSLTQHSATFLVPVAAWSFGATWTVNPMRRNVVWRSKRYPGPSIYSDAEITRPEWLILHRKKKKMSIWLISSRLGIKREVCVLWCRISEIFILMVLKTTDVAVRIWCSGLHIRQSFIIHSNNIRDEAHFFVSDTDIETLIVKYNIHGISRK